MIRSEMLAIYEQGAITRVLYVARNSIQNT